MRVAVKAVVALLALGVGLFALAGLPAGAVGERSGQMRNGATGQCLDGSAKLLFVYAEPCDNKWDGQIWQTNRAAPTRGNTTEPNEVTLSNKYNGKCLDSSKSGYVYTLPCEPGNRYQTWVEIVRRSGPNGLQVYRNAATGRCLDANPQGRELVYTLPCNGAGSQDWTRSS